MITANCYMPFMSISTACVPLNLFVALSASDGHCRSDGDDVSTCLESSMKVSTAISGCAGTAWIPSEEIQNHIARPENNIHPLSQHSSSVSGSNRMQLTHS